MNDNYFSVGGLQHRVEERNGLYDFETPELLLRERLSSDPHVNGEYLRNNPDWHTPSSAWKAQQVLKMLRRHNLAPLTVGEVGCGAGEVLRQLQLKLDSSCEFWGYDISPQAIDMTVGKENGRLHFKNADACQMVTPFFDLMLVLEVVDHVEDYFGFLRALKHKSKYKLFHFSLDLSVQNAIRPGALLKQRDTLVHLHYFNKETMLRTLQDTGYEVIDTFYTPYAMKFSPEPIGKLVKPLRWLFFQLNQDLAVRILGGYRLMVLAR
jgi:hypothetical protein